MHSGKKFTAVMLPTFLCLMAMLLASCGAGGGQSSGQRAPDTQQIYRWAFRLPDINTFDPGIATDLTSINAINLVFTGLVQLDNNLEVQPQLAQSYEKSKDGLTYTFHLRPGLKFSDGTKLDANDVAYSIDRALSPEIDHQSGVALTYLGLIKGAPDRVNGKVKTVIGSGVIVQDPDTVVIKVSKATSYFLDALAYPTSYVVERSVIGKWGQQWTDHLGDNGGQGGDGPFMVKVYDHNTGIKLIPNPYYYGPKPQLKELDYLPMKDLETSYNAYLAGQVDYTEVPVGEFDNAKTSKDFSQHDALAIFYIGLNYMVKPLDNIKIRQALALALDRETIVQAAYSSAYTPTCHIIPQGMYGYDPQLTCPDGTTPKGDANKARELFAQGLQESGLTPATFPTITLTYPTKNAGYADEVTTVVQMWKQVLGITVATTTLSQNTIYNLAVQTTGHVGPLQMWLAGWAADYPDPQDWTSLQFGAGQPYNEFNYGYNPGATAAQQRDLQKLMSAADVEPDKAKRAQMYNKIEQQLVDDVTWLSIYQRPDLRLVKPYVVGLQFNAFSQQPPNNWANVYITQH